MACIHENSHDVFFVQVSVQLAGDLEEPQVNAPAGVWHRGDQS
ncbi:hypothetical protein [Luteolibacter rhizosphaerae]|nr:hypothetical protein [Luteolibacter rhizosphaerae]